MALIKNAPTYITCHYYCNCDLTNILLLNLAFSISKIIQKLNYFTKPAIKEYI